VTQKYNFLRWSTVIKPGKVLKPQQQSRNYNIEELFSHCLRENEHHVRRGNMKCLMGNPFKHYIGRMPWCGIHIFIKSLHLWENGPNGELC
jgi:hypothetical protein